MRLTTWIATLMLASLSLLGTGAAQAPAQVPPGYGQPQPYAQPTPNGQPVYVVQQGDPAQYQALQARLYDLRVARSQYRIGGPIAMIAIGGGVAAISGLVCMSFALARSEEGDTGTLGTDLRKGVRVSGIFTAIGVGLVVGGGVRLAHRLRLRRQYDPEIHQIREQLRLMQGGVVMRVGANEMNLSFRLPF